MELIREITMRSRPHHHHEQQYLQRPALLLFSMITVSLCRFVVVVEHIITFGHSRRVRWLWVNVNGIFLLFLNFANERREKECADMVTKPLNSSAGWVRGSRPEWEQYLQTNVDEIQFNILHKFIRVLSKYIGEWLRSSFCFYGKAEFVLVFCMWYLGVRHAAVSTDHQWGHRIGVVRWPVSISAIVCIIHRRWRNIGAYIVHGAIIV